jgi:hypothetical protein
MGVPEAAESAAMADVGTVRIALAIGVGVVLAVIGDPVHDRALHRQRAQHGEDALEPGIGLERAVGEEPVETDRHADRGEQIHRPEDRQVGPVNRPVPEQYHGRQHADEREDDAKQVRVALRAGHG